MGQWEGRHRPGPHILPTLSTRGRGLSGPRGTTDDCGDPPGVPVKSGRGPPGDTGLMKPPAQERGPLVRRWVRGAPSSAGLPDPMRGGSLPPFLAALLLVHTWPLGAPPPITAAPAGPWLTTLLATSPGSPPQPLQHHACPPLGCSRQGSGKALARPATLPHPPSHPLPSLGPVSLREDVLTSAVPTKLASPVASVQSHPSKQRSLQLREPRTPVPPGPSGPPASHLRPGVPHCPQAETLRSPHRVGHPATPLRGGWARVLLHRI